MRQKVNRVQNLRRFGVFCASQIDSGHLDLPFNFFLARGELCCGLSETSMLPDLVWAGCVLHA